ncbi:hypothetical protein L209DRAFT_155216 [Thermothelomyces heterothallicus CBS 203.75]
MRTSPNKFSLGCVPCRSLFVALDRLREDHLRVAICCFSDEVGSNQSKQLIESSAVMLCAIAALISSCLDTLLGAVRGSKTMSPRIRARVYGLQDKRTKDGSNNGNITPRSAALQCGLPHRARRGPKCPPDQGAILSTSIEEWRRAPHLTGPASGPSNRALSRHHPAVVLHGLRSHRTDSSGVRYGSRNTYTNKPETRSSSVAKSRTAATKTMPTQHRINRRAAKASHTDLARPFPITDRELLHLRISSTTLWQRPSPRAAETPPTDKSRLYN